MIASPRRRRASILLLCLALAPANAPAQGVPQATRPAKPPAIFPILAVTVPHGRITPAGLVMVTSADSVEFVVEPDEGYHVARLIVDGRKAPGATRYVSRNVRARRTIVPEFELNTYKVTTSAGPNGSILPARPPAVRHGDELRLTIAPRTGYHIDSLYVDGVPVRPRDVVVLSDVTSAHDVSARFALNEYNITASADLHADISPWGVTSVDHGESVTFMLGADPGYSVRELLIDGKPVRAGGSSYTLSNVRDHHTIVARVTHSIATIRRPGPGEEWVAGEVREVHWLPLKENVDDSVEVRVSYHGEGGPWTPIWRGPLRTGSAEWRVPSLETDSLMVCITALGRGMTEGADFSQGLVRVSSSPFGSGAAQFFVRAVPSPATVGPVRLDYSVPMQGEAALEIYTVNGRQVWRQALGRAPAGERSCVWDGRLRGGELADPGIYFARLVTHRGMRHCRLVLLP